MQSQLVFYSEDGETIWIPLPKNLWRSAGRCNCPYCKGEEGFWDTLAVPAKKDPDKLLPHTWNVHYPELHHHFWKK